LHQLQNLFYALSNEELSIHLGKFENVATIEAKVLGKSVSVSWGFIKQTFCEGLFDQNRFGKQFCL